MDEEDRELGTITRSVAHDGSRKIHRGVWMLVFNNKGKLFMHKRSLTKDRNPGMWTISAGEHVTKGQTYAEAAARELKEELGVTAPLKFIKKILFESETEREISQIYKTTHEGPFTFHPDEVAGGEFFKLPELEQKILNNELQVSNWVLAILQNVCGILQKRRDLRKFISKEF